MITLRAQADWTAEQGLEIVVSLAERYYDRVDAGQFLEQLPTDMPLASLLRYFKIVLEYGSAKKRNLQVHACATAVSSRFVNLTSPVLLLFR